MRELANLKQITDYSSCDPTNLASFLSSLGQEYTKYTYSLLHGAIDRNTLVAVNEDLLLNECQIPNTIHRMKILEAAERKFIAFHNFLQTCLIFRLLSFSEINLP